jgi:hypothetical protein
MASAQARNDLFAALESGQLQLVPALAKRYGELVAAKIAAAPRNQRLRIYAEALNQLQSALRLVRASRAHTSVQLEQITADLSYRTEPAPPGSRFSIQA